MSAKWTVRFGIIRQIEFPAIVAIPGHRKNGNNTHKMERPRCTSRPTFSLQEKKKKESGHQDPRKGVMFTRSN
jgi:hypothetical protein